VQRFVIFWIGDIIDGPDDRTIKQGAEKRTPKVRSPGRNHGPIIPEGQAVFKDGKAIQAFILKAFSDPCRAIRVGGFPPTLLLDNGTQVQGMQGIMRTKGVR